MSSACLVLSMLVFKSLLVSVCILCEINECFRCLMLILPGPVVLFLMNIDVYNGLFDLW